MRKMNIQEIKGQECFWQKREKTSIEKGIIEFVDEKNLLICAIGEDSKKRYFSFKAFKEGGSLNLVNQDLLNEVRTYLLENEKKSKEKRQEEMQARKAEFLAKYEKTNKSPKKITTKKHK